MLCVMASDMHTPWKGGEIQRGGKVINQTSSFNTSFFTKNNNTQLTITDSPLSLWASCSAGFSAFPWVEVQRCGANAEDQRGGWFGAGEEVLGADGKHAPQEGRSRWGKTTRAKERKSSPVSPRAVDTKLPACTRSMWAQRLHEDFLA